MPVLINETNSLFSIAGVLAGADRPFPEPPSRARSVLSSLAPSLSANVVGERCYEAFARQVLELSTPAKVLVIGSRVAGAGMEVLTRNPDIQLVESDVELGPRPAVVFDAHDIPFEDETFDGVIAQAVLEHVADPVGCAEEIRRVLRPRGIVYAETPFMQQVHEGAYDFTRFTHLGHRRLWRDFDELDSGVACGPGMALAWAWRLLSLELYRATRHAGHGLGGCPGNGLLAQVLRSLPGQLAGSLRRGLGLLFPGTQEHHPAHGPAIAALVPGWNALAGSSLPTDSVGKGHPERLPAKLIVGGPPPNRPVTPAASAAVIQQDCSSCWQFETAVYS